MECSKVCVDYWKGEIMAITTTTANVNSNLSRAKTEKDDEFYTQREDIERELKHYKHHFRGKVVYCNCDDPRESQFFFYFSHNFEHLGLKKLIATCYKNQNMELFSQNDCEKAIYLEYDGDKNGNKVPDTEEIDVKNLKSNGDFRDAEMIELLKTVDIVVTNPPFSKFRQYLAQLVEYDKKFLIIGNQNAITYKEVFTFIQKNKLWIGYNSGDMEFKVPENSKERATRFRQDETGQKWRSLGNITWYTNLDIKKRHEPLTLYRKYTPENYPKYDNYDAIEVGFIAKIPMDYKGIMGVPITFMNSYNPDQFEILGLSQKVGYGLESNKFYDDYKETRQDGTKTGSSGKKANGNPIMKGMSKKNNYFTKGDDIVHSLYARIFIRNKTL